MAKKVVATLKDKTRVNLTKVIIPVKNEKTGAYSFQEEIIPQDQVKDYLAKNAPLDEAVALHFLRQLGMVTFFDLKKVSCF